MNMKRVLPILLSLFAVAHAQTTSIKGIQMGAPLFETAKQIGISCRPDAGDGLGAQCERFGDDRIARDFSTIAGADVVDIHLAGHEDRIASIEFRFPADAFPDVLEAVGSRYGKLTCERSVVNNAFGARFDQVECTSLNNNLLLNLDKRSKKVDVGRVALRTREYLLRFRDTARSKRKDDI